MTESGPRPFSALGEAGRNEYWAALALRHCPGIGARSRARLLQQFGSAYAAVRAADEWPRAGLNKRQAGEFARGTWRKEARREWDAARELDAVILLWPDTTFPQLLRELPDGPALLYLSGDAGRSITKECFDITIDPGRAKAKVRSRSPSESTILMIPRVTI